MISSVSIPFLVAGAIFCQAGGTAQNELDQEFKRARDELVGSKPRFPGRPEAVAVKFTATVPDAKGRQKIEVILDIKPNWLVYANPVGDEDFQELQTQLSISSARGTKLIRTVYPRGEFLQDKLVRKGGYYVYKGKIKLIMEVDRPRAERQPFEMRVYVHPQNHVHFTCGWPLIFKLQVP